MRSRHERAAAGSRLRESLLERAASLLRRGKLDLALADCDGALRGNCNAAPGGVYLQTNSQIAVDEINRAMLTASPASPAGISERDLEPMQPSVPAVAHLPERTRPPGPAESPSVAAPPPRLHPSRLRISPLSWACTPAGLIPGVRIMPMLIVIVQCHGGSSAKIGAAEAGKAVPLSLIHI